MRPELLNAEKQNQATFLSSRVPAADGKAPTGVSNGSLL